MFLFKRGNIYYVEYIDTKTRKQRRLSTKERSRDKALSFAQSILSSNATNYLQANETNQNDVITLAQYKDEYCRFVEGMYSQKYVRSIKLSFREMMKSVENKNLREISIREIDHFLMTKYQSSMHASHLYLRTLKAAFNKAINWGYLENNPFVKIKLPKPAKNNPVFINEKELEIILSETEEEDMRDIFKVAFFTGMRLGEIVNLKIDQVNLTEKAINLKNDNSFRTKNRSERMIPISKKINGILRKRVGSQENYIFTKLPGIKYNEDYISKQFKSTVRKTDLSDSLHFHILRHSFASNLVRRGASIYIVKELLGHQSIATTQIYSHLEKDSLVDAIKIL